MTSVVLDASALLALLLEEKGAELVQSLLPDAAMTTVNLAEVVGHLARNGAATEDIHAILDLLPIELVPLDEDLAYRAGLLTPITKAAGLSFGDRSCLALAQRTGLRAITADRQWKAVASAAGVEVELIR